jgi:hypothetical protein
LPWLKRADAIADHVDAADDFMPGDDGKLGIRQFTINDMQVSAAHPTCRYPHSDFARCGPGVGPFHQSERHARPLQYHRLHAGNLWRDPRAGKPYS